jgi:hypothetical protein
MLIHVDWLDFRPHRSKIPWHRIPALFVAQFCNRLGRRSCECSTEKHRKLNRQTACPHAQTGCCHVSTPLLTRCHVSTPLLTRLDSTRNDRMLEAGTSQLNSTQFNSTQLSSAQLNSTQLNLTHLNRPRSQSSADTTCRMHSLSVFHGHDENLRKAQL